MHEYLICICSEGTTQGKQAWNEVIFSVTLISHHFWMTRITV